MADRFWVGGSGTWDAADTSHWSATSGGAGGASVPTASDDVFFDASSGAGTATLGAQAYTRNLDCTGYAGTLAQGTCHLITSFVCPVCHEKGDPDEYAAHAATHDELLSACVEAVATVTEQAVDLGASEPDVQRALALVSEPSIAAALTPPVPGSYPGRALQAVMRRWADG